MFKKIRERSLHFMIFAFLTGLFLGVNLSFKAEALEPAHGYLDYFHQVYQIVRTEYVDTVETKNLFYGAIRGMLQALNDPFTRFLNEEDFAELKEETTGKFVGVGIEITMKNGEIIVISPIDDTPAMKAGIKAGDKITKIDTSELKDKSLPDIIKLIRGLPHTKVKLTVVREGFDDPITFELERMPIKIDAVSYDVLKDNDTGYIKVKTFSSDTTREIEKALNDLNARGIRRVIVDLRWNPGGLLDQAISMSDLFLDKGKTIVSTRGREGSGNFKEYLADRPALFRGGLAVLVNKGSASASEIFAGAIKDNRRGKLVGEKTFGKGSVQKSYNLNEKIGLALTIAKYYTPSGVSIHGKGIEPDFVVSSESFPEEDRKNVNAIYREKLVDAFVKTHKGYTPENRKEFMEFLKGHNLPITERSAGYILKNEIYRFSRQPLFDLEFDSQLKKAIEVVGKES
jgi:carboxyl-terminal processing protease